jgi:hypothetical protein
MQSNPEVLSQVKKLESLYAKSNNVNVTTNVNPNAGFDAEKVTIVGAALNGNEGAQMNFGIEKADKNSEVLVDKGKYSKTVQYNFKLTGTAEGSGLFRVPVRVTMPNPLNIPVHRLVILHYKADGSYETIQPYDNGDGTVSFTVKSFSPFVFAEENEEEQIQNEEQNQENQENQQIKTDKSKGWIPTPEEQRRLGLMGQLVEIAYASSNYKVDLEGTSQGPKFFDAIESHEKNYTILATYNVKLDYQLLYNHDGSTRIAMTLPPWFRNREEKLVMVGVDKNGTPIECADLDADEKTYTFKLIDSYAYALCSLSK